MNVKDILKKIDGLSPEISNLISSEIEKEIEKEIGGLVSKKNELLDKVRKKDATENAELEQLRRFKESKDVEELESKKHYEEALKITETKYKKELERTAEALRQKESTLSDLIFNSEISKNFDVHKINPVTREALTALFKQKSKYSENGFLVEEKPLTEYLSEWAKTDQAKPFVLAPQNSGGNSFSQSAKPVDQTNLTQLIQSKIGR